ncbi:hypothetical protein J1N35_023295 [Gossypium stocksii]|uniref:Uncharacterized protein n=1 Tax=Gossypium stocksii TaxID=47602 RepID=A0A9D3VJA9_9ROSI|nr:hypothetical protein J1N35_023295 [Gossypium stocksii]
MRHSRRPPLYVLEGEFSPTPEYAAWYMSYGKPFIFQGQYMLIQKDANTRPRNNRVPLFGNIESDTSSNPDLDPQYEASGSSSHNLDPNPLREIPPSFEDIFGDDIDPQHSTRSGLSSYHSELHPEAHTPTTEDIFPSVLSVTTSDRPLEAEPSNYQTPEQGARHHRRRHPDRYTPAPGTSPGSRQF